MPTTATTPLSIEMALAAAAGLLTLLLIVLQVYGRELRNRAAQWEKKLEELTKDVTTLKASAPKQLEDRLTKVECDLSDLRLKVAEKLITKEEFKETINDLKDQMHGLKDDIAKSNEINAEQAKVLARIEAMMQSLLS